MWNGDETGWSEVGQSDKIADFKRAHVIEDGWLIGMEAFKSRLWK